MKFNVKETLKNFVDIFEDVVQFLFLFFIFYKRRSSHRLLSREQQFIEIWTNFISRRTQTKLNFSLPFVSWIFWRRVPADIRLTAVNGVIVQLMAQREDWKHLDFGISGETETGNKAQ